MIFSITAIAIIHTISTEAILLFDITAERKNITTTINHISVSFFILISFKGTAKNAGIKAMICIIYKFPIYEPKKARTVFIITDIFSNRLLLLFILYLIY